MKISSCCWTEATKKENDLICSSCGKPCLEVRNQTTVLEEIKELLIEILKAINSK